MATTRKKVKVIGTETYIKQDTGEIAEMQVVQDWRAWLTFS